MVVNKKHGTHTQVVEIQMIWLLMFKNLNFKIEMFIKN